MKNILMIDDEMNFCSLVKWNLESTALYRVTTASYGKQGLRLAKQDRPDLILLDLRMPGMSGFEVLRILKADPQTSQIPVVVLTAVSSEDNRCRAASLYNDAYLEKTVGVDVLKDKIGQLLETV